MNRILKHIVLCIFFLAGFALNSNAQFKEGAFTQTYNDQADTTGFKDTTDKLFSFKEFFGGLAHKNTLKIGTMFAGSVILPGSAQIYNNQYWKLPIIYGGIGALAGPGGYYFHKHKKSVKAYETYLETKAIYESAHGIPYPYEAPQIDTRAKTTGTWLMVGAGLVYWGSLMDGVASFKSDRYPHPGQRSPGSIRL